MCQSCCEGVTAAGNGNVRVCITNCVGDERKGVRESSVGRGRCELRGGRKGEAEDAPVGMHTTERPERPVWLNGGEDGFFASKHTITVEIPKV